MLRLLALLVFVVASTSNNLSAQGTSGPVTVPRQTAQKTVPEQIAVIGSVHRPGVFSWDAQVSGLSGWLLRADGLRPEASGNIRLIRDGRSCSQTFLRPGEHPSPDHEIPVRPGDVIVVDQGVSASSKSVDDSALQTAGAPVAHVAVVNFSGLISVVDLTDQSHTVADLVRHFRMPVSIEQVRILSAPHRMFARLKSSIPISNQELIPADVVVLPPGTSLPNPTSSARNPEYHPSRNSKSEPSVNPDNQQGLTAGRPGFTTEDDSDQFSAPAVRSRSVATDHGLDRKIDRVPPAKTSISDPPASLLESPQATSDSNARPSALQSIPDAEKPVLPIRDDPVTELNERNVETTSEAVFSTPSMTSNGSLEATASSEISLTVQVVLALCALAVTGLVGYSIWYVSRIDRDEASFTQFEQAVRGDVLESLMSDRLSVQQEEPVYRGVVKRPRMQNELRATPAPHNSQSVPVRRDASSEIQGPHRNIVERIQPVSVSRHELDHRRAKVAERFMESQSQVHLRLDSLLDRSAPVPEEHEPHETDGKPTPKESSEDAQAAIAGERSLEQRPVNRSQTTVSPSMHGGLLDRILDSLQQDRAS